MSAAHVRRLRPLVYCTPAVLERGRRLLPGVILENEVANAILAGRVSTGRDGGLVQVTENVIARVRRTPCRVRPKPRAWTVIAIERPGRRFLRSAVIPVPMAGTGPRSGPRLGRLGAARYLKEAERQ